MGVPSLAGGVDLPARQTLHGADDVAGSTTFRIGCVRIRPIPGSGSSTRPTGGRPDRSEERDSSLDQARRVKLRQHPVTSFRIWGTPHLHSANAAAHDAAASPPSRANPLSRIHNPVRHPPEPLMVRSPAAGLSTASSQPICNVPAPSLHPYLGRMRHSQCHDLLLWSLWVGRPRQEGMAVRRNVHRFIFAVAFGLPDLRQVGASNGEGFRPGGPW